MRGTRWAKWALLGCFALYLGSAFFPSQAVKVLMLAPTAAWLAAYFVSWWRDGYRGS